MNLSEQLIASLSARLEGALQQARADARLGRVLNAEPIRGVHDEAAAWIRDLQADNDRLYEREASLLGVLHELIRPDNGACNQCEGPWLYRLDGTWDYLDGEHTPSCIGKTVYTPL